VFLDEKLLKRKEQAPRIQSHRSRQRISVLHGIDAHCGLGRIKSECGAVLPRAATMLVYDRRHYRSENGSAD
jgi:hypothetical protein